MELHVFSDASSRAYATTVYAKGDNSCQLIFAKSRLCPLKGLTIPRLELLAVLIGVRASNFVIARMQLNDVSRTLWSDMKCTLAWIKNPATEKLPRFVKNRLQEIHKTAGITYRHVPTEDNPADLATRGVTPQELARSTIWWHGPQWLVKDPVFWPVQGCIHTTDALTVEEETEEEALNSVTTSATTTVQVRKNFHLMDTNRFSSWNRLLNTTSWVLRFLRKVSPHRISWLKEGHTTGPLRTADHRAALACLIKQAQNEGITHKDISRWNLITDSHGIWRCSGRLITSSLPRDEKYPIYLPRHSEISKLLILNSHHALSHGGVGSTLTHIRKKYWVHQGRQATRSVIHDRCIACRRWSAAPFSLPNAPPLPETRTQPSPPFSHTAVDYFGPINVKTADGSHKKWVSLFTCFTTRAIHLEVADDLSARVFIDCFRRFIARRGTPLLMLSDNGTNFKLAAKALKEVRDDLLNRQIEWRFVTALTPWKGGLYERLVGIVKTAMRKTIGKRFLTE